MQVDEPADIQQQLGQLGKFLTLQQQKLEEQGNMIEQQAIFQAQLIPQLQRLQAQVDTMQCLLQQRSKNTTPSASGAQSPVLVVQQRSTNATPSASGAQSPVLVVQIHSPRATD